MKTFAIANKKLFFQFIFIISFVLISFLLAHHLLQSYFEYKTFLFESGEFYEDRLINISIAKTAQHYGLNFFDPFNRQEVIFYQFFPYWILGFLAGLLNANPWSIANLIQLFLAPALFLTTYFLGKRLTGSKIAALVAVYLMFAFGSLEYLVTRTTDVTIYGEHAIIIQFLRNIYSFALDNYSVLFGYIALIFFIAMLKDKKYNPKTSLPFIFFATVSYNVHYLPAIFFIVLYGIILFASTYYDSDRRRKQNMIFTASASAVYLFVLFFFSFRPPMLFLVLAAGAFFVYFFIIEKNRVPYYALAISIIPMILMIGFNVYMAKITGSTATYNDAIRTRHLYIPPLTFLVAYFPLIILSLFAFFKSEKKGVQQYFGPMLLAMLIVVYNNAFGYNNHPYRFIPYVFPLLAIISAQGIRVLFCRERIISARNVLVSILVIFIAFGSYLNIAFYLRYSHSTSKPVPEIERRLVASIDKIFNRNNDAIFYLDPGFVTTDKVAPFTGAKFFFSAPISFSVKFTPDKVNGLSAAIGTGNLTTTSDYILSNKIAIDYIITDKIKIKNARVANKAGIRLIEKNSIFSVFKVTNKNL